MSQEPWKAGWLGSATLVAKFGRWSAGTARLEFGFRVACCKLAHERGVFVSSDLRPQNEETMTYIFQLRSLVIVVGDKFRASHERVPLLNVT